MRIQKILIATKCPAWIVNDRIFTISIGQQILNISSFLQGKEEKEVVTTKQITLPMKMRKTLKSKVTQPRLVVV